MKQHIPQRAHRSLPMRTSSNPDASSVTSNSMQQDMLQREAPLPHRQEMETLFGQDFSGVTVILGLSLDDDALASTEGETIYFDTPRPDRMTVAHELTHIVQNRQAGPGTGSTPAAASDATEKQAEDVAQSVAQRDPNGVQSKLQYLARPTARVQHRRRVLATSTVKETDKKTDAQLYRTLNITVPADKLPESVLYEQLAHRFAYLDTLNDNHQKWLEFYGYTSESAVTQGHSDTQWRTFVPTKKGLQLGRKPVLAFRGTASMQDVLTDLQTKGVGAYAFANNIEAISAALKALGGGTVVTGHSLGGGLAQYTACYLPSMVSRVVTFQSPAIDEDSVRQLRQYNARQKDPAKKVTSTHHIGQDDLIANAGYARTNGTIQEYQVSSARPDHYHRAFIATSVFNARGMGNAWDQTTTRVQENRSLLSGYSRDVSTTRQNDTQHIVGRVGQPYRTDQLKGSYTNYSQCTSASERIRATGPLLAIAAALKTGNLAALYKAMRLRSATKDPHARGRLAALKAINQGRSLQDGIDAFKKIAPPRPKDLRELQQVYSLLHSQKRTP